MNEHQKKVLYRLDGVVNNMPGNNKLGSVAMREFSINDMETPADECFTMFMGFFGFLQGAGYKPEIIMRTVDYGMNMLEEQLDIDLSELYDEEEDESFEEDTKPEYSGVMASKRDANVVEKMLNKAKDKRNMIDDPEKFESFKEQLMEHEELQKKVYALFIDYILDDED